MMSNFSGFGTSKFEVFRVLAASRRVEGCSTIIWQVVSGSIDLFPQRATHLLPVEVLTPVVSRVMSSAPNTPSTRPW